MENNNSKHGYHNKSIIKYRNHIIIVCLENTSKGKLIGFMHYREMPSPLRGSLVGFLDDLYVHPAHRGTGAVQLLFKELKGVARQNGWPYVRWITATDNHRARSVYDKISDTIDFVTYQMPSQ